ncbi:efflux RND transporter permease subunit [Lacipirellula parvula]|uniref:Membrane transport protein MMPL domain-containing protein n=1 Tax=Lacipirellula parvula TaxID=2650471 RepID=A0A5K7XMR6_9BACT|nr:MMPL family transporter [Lacipirellula parvula]BBO34389.1 hypothetical protein PLANPX_4001 [Lacipirellula parvula]
MAKPSILDRYKNQILILAVLLTPLACYGAIKAIANNRNDVSDWLPKSYPETVELRWFRKHFAADQFILVSWDGAELGEAHDGSQDDPRIQQLADALLEVKLPEKAGGGQAFTTVTTARSVLKQLMSPPQSLTRKDATKRLEGGLIGGNGKQTVVMATLSPEASANLKYSVSKPKAGLGLKKWPTSPLYQALDKVGLDRETIRLGGPPIDNVSIDDEGEKTLLRLAGLAGLLGISLAYWSLRNVWMTALVFMCGIISAAVSLAMVPLLGHRMDAILMSMPALIYVLAVSGAVHIINYYRQACMEQGNLDHAIEHAVVHAWRPAILCAVTSGIGLASLLTSDILPIAKFGGFSALGNFTMLIVLFMVLPAAMKKWPWTPPELKAMQAGKAVQKHDDEPEFGAAGWTRFGNFIRRHHALVLGASMATIVVLCAGLPRITTSIDLLKLFSDDARLLADYRWFENNLGRIVPMELVVRFPRETQFEAAPENLAPGQKVNRHTFFERMKLVERIEKSIERKLGKDGDDLIGATMSAATFAPDLGGDESGVGAATYRGVVNKRLLASRKDLEESGFLRVEGPDAGERAGDELWRISVRVAAFHDINHGELVTRMRNAVNPVLTARTASVDALEGLSQRRHGQPNGAKVVALRLPEAKGATDDVVAFINTKNVVAQSAAVNLEALSDEQIQKNLAPFDGVILTGGYGAHDYERLRSAEIPILASFESAAKAVEHDVRAEHGAAGVDVVFTGVIPVVYKAQHALLESLISSTWWSFMTITPLMMFVCRGFAAGAVVMVPNTLPVLVVFGGMGWLGIPVDIGSMMAASIALGVAVDDTIHFLAWYKDDLKNLGDRAEATLCSYRRSANATLQAGLINGLGLSVFATSSFTPTQRFGWLMLTILVAGIVAELIMLPSIMFGPIGRVFDLKKRKSRPATEPIDVRGRVDSVLSPLDRRRALREHGASLKV